MSDHIGLRYLFHRVNFNVRQARCLGTISEFDFEIRYIKGKENRVTDAINMWVNVNHIETMRSYGSDLQDKIL